MLASLRILVADDNETIRNGLCSVLEGGWNRRRAKSRGTQTRHYFSGCFDARVERV